MFTPPTSHLLPCSLVPWRSAASRMPLSTSTPPHTRPLTPACAQSRYIERAPPCTLPPPARLPHPASVKGRKSAAAKAGSAAAAAEQALALRSLEEITYGKARFKLPQVGHTDEAAGKVGHTDEGICGAEGWYCDVCGMVTMCRDGIAMCGNAI
eukprot:366387-Chlamydomonas_euryale.AAC.15